MPDRPGPGAALLDELPEAQARGEALRIYGEIRRLSGVPMVALIYRHLATLPGALEWAWSLVGPLMASGRLPERAWRAAREAALPAGPRIPRAALRALGITDADEAAVDGVLQAYNRANPVNVLVVRLLQVQLARDAASQAHQAPLAPQAAWATSAGAAGPAEGGPSVGAGPTPWPDWQPPTPVTSLPAMVPPAEMSPSVRELVILLTDRVEGGTPSALWPSLYRHLAHWPGLLALFAVIVEPAFPRVDAAAAGLGAAIDEAVAELSAALPHTTTPGPAGAAAEGLRAGLASFSARIPEMVVLGALLAASMPAAHTPSTTTGDPDDRPR